MSHASFEELALGAALHDIGKFMQRACALRGGLPAEARRFEADLLPGEPGRYTHRHALWSWAFFDELERRGLTLPGASLPKVRELACYHHRPLQQNPLTTLVQVADQLASGMERKPQDEALEADSGERNWTDFVKTPLENVLSNLDLGAERRAKTYVPLTELAPGDEILPLAPEKLRLENYPELYERLWNAFFEEFARATALGSFELFAETLLSLSERYTFAIPSSTVDQPDIPLHDHHRAVAAVACALYRWHEADGSLDDVRRIRDRETTKFCFLVGDLSGIQDGLFRLAAQRVRGANRILRARSFLLSMIVEAGALLCRRELALAPFSVLQAAGGRFLILAPARSDLEERLATLRRQIDAWMMDRFLGEVTLNIGLTEPIAGAGLTLERFSDVQAALRHAAAVAKLRPAELAYRAVHRRQFPLGEACSACGVRPAESADGALYCRPCNEERRLGGDLPHTHVFRFSEAPAGGIALFGGLNLEWGRFREADIKLWRSAFRLWGDATEKPAGPVLPLRFLANYVPLWDGELTQAYRSLVSPETLKEEAEPGSPKLFEMIAADAVEVLDSGDSETELAGESMLAVLKADVDRLGELFTRGLGTPSLARFATLSRMLDFFFSAQLMKRVRERFPDTYTVYAGGDDLLLIGPWRQMIELALALRTEFERWCGANANVTLSAGVEFAKAHHPLTRTAPAADERLDAAKDAGRNRISAVDLLPQPWESFARAWADAEALNRLLRAGVLSTAFLYKILTLDAMRRRAEDSHQMDLNAAAWRARWRYLRARHLESRQELVGREEILALLDRILGVDGSPPTARTAASIALYRNRKPETRR